MQMLKPTANALLLHNSGAFSVSYFFVPPLIRGLDAEEIMYIDRYRQGAALNLARSGSLEFWFRSVLREMVHDTCIRHCVIGIGALDYALELEYHEQRTATVDAKQVDKKATSPHYQRAFKHSTTAIQLMLFRTRTQPETMSYRTILMASLLLIVFELMQGNPEAADGLASTAMHTLKDSLTPCAPVNGSALKIGREADDEGIHEAQWFLPRLATLRGGTRNLPIALPANTCKWMRGDRLTAHITALSSPEEHSTHRAFM